MSDKRVTLRLPPQLYQEAAAAAERDNVALNWWVIVQLARALGYHTPPEPRQQQARPYHPTGYGKWKGTSP